MGVNGKIVLSLLLVATLAHGQLSVDLNGGDITAPLQHQGKIQQQFSPENIDRTYGDATGQQLTLSQPGGAYYSHPVIRAPPDFQTLRRPCKGSLERTYICETTRRRLAVTEPEKRSPAAAEIRLS